MDNQLKIGDKVYIRSNYFQYATIEYLYEDKAGPMALIRFKDNAVLVASISSIRKPDSPNFKKHDIITDHISKIEYEVVDVNVEDRFYRIKPLIETETINIDEAHQRFRK